MEKDKHLQEQNQDEKFATIIHVPLLVDPTVDPIIIPGICKVLERFYLVYRTKDLINLINTRAKKELPGKMRLKNKKLTLEQWSPEELKEQQLTKAQRAAMKDPYDPDDPDMIPFNQTGIHHEPEDPVVSKEPDLTSAQRATMHEPEEKYDPEVKKPIPYKADVSAPSTQQISLEPTYIKVDTGMEIRMVGIKVIPYTLKSNVSLAELLTRESHYNFLQTKLVSVIRGTVRGILNILRRRLKWFWPSRALTGDVKKDILWEGSSRVNAYFLLNSRDVQNISYNEINIRRLYKMKWGSFLICDDIAKNVKFCMRDFNGLCSSIPYGFIYNIVGKEAMKTYEDLSDVKKSVSPLFRMKTKTSKLFGMMKAKAKLERFRKITKRKR